MPRARLTLDVPETVWIGDISRQYPDTRIRILAAIAEDEVGVGLAEVTSSSLAAVVTSMSDADSVTDLDVLKRSDGTALVEFETTEPLLLFPIQDAGVPLEMPFDIRNGSATWELTAPQHRLSALGEQLDAFGISFTVEYVRQHVEEERPLTDRQRRLVVAAVENGYYDTPRTCSLTELADVVGIAKSTCSETLHRAEETIVKRFVEELPEADRPDVSDDSGRETEAEA